MPELPEVQTVVQSLQSKLPGRRVEQALLYRTDIIDPAGFDLPQHLAKQTIAGITRRGKRIIFRLADGNRFYIHLGMTGRLTIESTEAVHMPHTHLILKFAGDELRFVDPRRFGGIWWLGKSEPEDKRMGPEPLSIRPAALGRQLAGTTRAIKNALLDQAVIAGLGNIYVDESLFAAGIHPLTQANKLTPGQIAKLNRSIKATLRKALRHKGSTLRDYRDADGNSGAFQKLHRVYGREGEPCAKCGAAIQRIVLGGRSTCFCGRCQVNV